MAKPLAEQRIKEMRKHLDATVRLHAEAEKKTPGELVDLGLKLAEIVRKACKLIHLYIHPSLSNT